MVNYWLAKQEPSGPRGYHILDLKKDKTTVWDGIHNNLALKHMRGAKKGDQIMYYHTGVEKQVVGLMTITSDPYPNLKENNKRFIVVDVKFKKLFKNPVTLDEMKLQKSFKNWELLRIMRLSFMPVPENIWKTILKLSNK